MIALDAVKAEEQHVLSTNPRDPSQVAIEAEHRLTTEEESQDVIMIEGDEEEATSTTAAEVHP